MLVVATADGARLDPGALGLAVARFWSEADSPVVFVDGDASGPRLAARYGATENADYSPANRGLPSLMVARKPLTLRLLAEHCYSLSTPAGSLWALFGPRHPQGAAQAAGWLAERRGQLLEIDGRRRVVASASLTAGGEHADSLLRAASVVVVVAAVASAEQAEALGERCRRAGLDSPGRGPWMLIVEDGSVVPDEHIEAETGMRIVGRLPVIDDEKALKLQGGRRERAFANRLRKIADALLALSDDAAASSALAEAEALVEAESPVDADALAERLDDVGVRADADTLAEALAAAQADADALVDANKRSGGDRSEAGPGPNGQPNGRPDGQPVPAANESALLWPVQRVGETGREGRA